MSFKKDNIVKQAKQQQEQKKRRHFYLKLFAAAHLIVQCTFDISKHLTRSFTNSQKDNRKGNINKKNHTHTFPLFMELIKRKLNYKKITSIFQKKKYCLRDWDGS